MKNPFLTVLIGLAATAATAQATPAPTFTLGDLYLTIKNTTTNASQSFDIGNWTSYEQMEVAGLGNPPAPDDLVSDPDQPVGDLTSLFSAISSDFGTSFYDAANLQFDVSIPNPVDVTNSSNEPLLVSAPWTAMTGSATLTTNDSEIAPFGGNYGALSFSQADGPLYAANFGLDETQTAGDLLLTNPVPEPSTYALLAAGLVGLILIQRSRRLARE